MAQDNTVSLTYCATRSSQQNEFMRKLVCPAKKTECPNTQDDIMINIREQDKEYTKEFNWWHQVPTDDARDYHCKYMIRADRSLIASRSQNDMGYIFL